MEERGGSRRERFARAAARGREETTPLLLHFGVIGVVGAFVVVVLVVAIVLWAVLR